jgi:hypothetical protein
MYEARHNSRTNTWEGCITMPTASKSSSTRPFGVRKRIYRRLGRMFLRWSETSNEDVNYIAMAFWALVGSVCFGYAWPLLLSWHWRV